MADPAGRSAQFEPLIWRGDAPCNVDTAQRQEQKGGEAARRDRAAAAGGGAEFRELFVSLVDPAGVLDMKRCGETARRMREAAAKSGYRSGVRMAFLLADIFADAGDIVDRPVEDGALHHTTFAHREIITRLYDAAESYRAGGTGEPVGELEELRKRVAVLRSEADVDRAELAAADPPGSGLVKFDTLFRGKICKDVIKKGIEEVRERRKADGEDPIFPPERETLEEIFARCDEPMWSSAEMIDWERGKGPPEGYELVRVKGG